MSSVLLLSLTWKTAFCASQCGGSETPPCPHEFGHTLRTRFLLDESYTNLNHGSYGAPPRVVLEAQREWQERMERNPDVWFRFDGPDTLIGALDHVRERLASFIGATDPRDLVFVDGASGGVNAVIRSIRLPPTASILYLNTAYPMVKNTVQYVHEHDVLEKPLEVSITIPSSDEDIVVAVDNALTQNPSVRLASFSHITSVPAVILPVKKLVQVCHRRGVMVLIDGAHALGQIPLQVEDIGADFYVANGHKWLYSPKGSAILWATPARQDMIHPNVINYEGRGPTPFQSQFQYTGTKDYSAFLAMSSALDFRESLGGEARIMEYMHQLASQGGEILAKAWGTEKLVEDGRIGAMVNVRLPDVALACCNLNLSNAMFASFSTWVPVYLWGGRCFVRVSAQIYNDASDFELLARAALEILKASSGPCQGLATGSLGTPELRE